MCTVNTTITYCKVRVWRDNGTHLFFGPSGVFGHGLGDKGSLALGHDVLTRITNAQQLIHVASLSPSPSTTQRALSRVRSGPLAAGAVAAASARRVRSERSNASFSVPPGAYRCGPMRTGAHCRPPGNNATRRPRKRMARPGVRLKRLNIYRRRAARVHDARPRSGNNIISAGATVPRYVHVRVVTVLFYCRCVVLSVYSAPRGRPASRQMPGYGAWKTRSYPRRYLRTDGRDDTNTRIPRQRYTGRMDTRRARERRDAYILLSPIGSPARARASSCPPPVTPCLAKVSGNEEKRRCGDQP